jgi:exodeoxyribonuclease III
VSYRAILVGMKLYSWNVNGIRAVIKKGALDSFIKTHNPDILCLQETKAAQGQAEVDLPDYQEFWNSAVKKGYSGTAIFTKQKPISVLNGFAANIAAEHGIQADSYGDPDKEGRVITAEYADFYVVNVYTPNSKGDLGRLQLRHKHWDPAFLAHVQHLENTKPVIFCGDLNVAHKEIDLARPKQNVYKNGFTIEERQGFQRFIDHGFCDTFRIFNQEGGNYTWWTYIANSRARNVGWRIDYFLVSRMLREKVKSAEIHSDTMGSDHCPVSVDIDL